jgi:hypothetical protein
MEKAEKPVQTSQKPHKKRSQEEKVGRVKYTLEVQKQIQRDIEEIKLKQRALFAGLRGMFNFQQPMIEKLACSDEVDVEILQLLREAGGVGLLPRDLAEQLTAYKVTRHQASRRIQRMNRRLEKEIGERLIEKHGWKWALTSFAHGVWGETEASEILAKDLKDNEEE